jgi:hypothetical protein
MNCLIEFRKNNFFTKQEMANKLGVSLSLYEKVECSDRHPSRSFLSKFKEVFPSYDMNIFFKELLHETCIEKNKPA